MSGFIIEMTPPKGSPTEYYPEGFGFTCHEHATVRAKAKIFTDAESASRTLHSYRFPPAFWEIERRHRENMDRKYRDWQFRVVPA